MGLDGEHLDLDLALSEAESPLGHDICLFDRISVRLSGSLSTSRSKNVTGSVLAEDSRPAARSKRYPVIVTAPRLRKGRMPFVLL